MGLRQRTHESSDYKLYDDLAIGIAILSPEGVIKYANNAFQELLHCKLHEALQCNFFNSTQKGEDYYLSFLGQPNHSSDKQILSDTIRAHNGKNYFVEFHISPINNNDILLQISKSELIIGSELSVDKILFDYASLIDLENEFIAVIDQDGIIIGKSQSTDALFPAVKNRLIGMPVQQLVIKEELSGLGVIEHIKNTEIGKTVRFEARLNSSPEVKPFEIIAKKDAYQEQPFYVLKGRDISLRYEFEHKLNHTLDIFNIITRYTTDVICIFNEHQDLVYMNPVIKKLTGFTVDELMKKGFHNTILEADRSQVQRIIKESVTKRETASRYKYRQLRKNGTHFWLEVNAIRRYDANGKIIQTIANLRDVDDQVKTEESILRHERLLLETQKLASLGSWSYDFREQRLYFGKEFAEMFNMDMTGLEHPALFLSRLSLEDKIKLLKAWNILTVNGLTFNVDFDFQINEKRILSLNVIGYPERDLNGNIIAVRGAVMDITARKVTEKRLLALKEKAEIAAKAKHQFLSNMSHELRTPMNAVLGLTSLLLEESPTQAQKEKLDVLQFSAESLLHIIDDILDINALEENKLKLSPVKFELKSHLENIHKIFTPKAKEKQIDFNLNLGELPKNIVLDKNRLNQVLYNLIGNAIKFTDEGSVNLTVYEQTDGNIFFEVKDTGIGIPEDELKQIFERFYRSNFSDNYKYSGTGLGLSISERLLELMQSELQVESKIGEGTRFYFEICPECVENRIPSIKVGYSPEAITHQEFLNILIAEDNKLNQFLLEKILSKFNLSITIVDNGLEALNVFHNDQFDLVLLDIQMPKLNGNETAKSIREINANIPIIAMTAAVMNHDLEQTKKAGFNDVISKPFKPADLEYILSKYSAQRQLLSSN